MQLVEKEINEAIIAGERALDALYSAHEQLKKARTWGLLDLFGGGGFTALMKHSRLSNASADMEHAKYELRRFRKELGDVEGMCDLNLNIGDFLVFADFFFDGLIADWMVQSRINEAGRQVEEAIYRVEDILNQLQNM